MNHRKLITSPIGSTLAALVALSFLASISTAQTGPALLIKPWPETGQVFEGTGDAYFFEAGHTKNPDNSFRLQDYETVGRFRILPGNELSPRIGYDITFLDNHTTNRSIPNQLTDASVAIGTGVAKYQGWLVGVTLGAGYAGSHAFGVGSGWYGKADIVVAREINDNDALGLILDYDGNRAYFPDLPLPGFGFSHRFDPKLQVVAGLPYSSLDWKPIDHLEIQAEARLYSDLKVSAAYEFLKGWSVYGTAGYVRDAFHVDHIDGASENRRLLFYQRRAELGVKYTPCEFFNFKVGLGYGWDGSYRSGFDFDTTRFVANINDVPYFHGGLEMKF